jgi:triosephosphate isomerase
VGHPKGGLTVTCACSKKAKGQYLWYKDEGSTPRVYNSEIEAKAKVLRKGGKYITYNPNVSIGTQIAAAETLARQQRG